MGCDACPEETISSEHTQKQRQMKHELVTDESLFTLNNYIIIHINDQWIKTATHLTLQPSMKTLVDELVEKSVIVVLP